MVEQAVMASDECSRPKRKASLDSVSWMRNIAASMSKKFRHSKADSSTSENTTENVKESSPGPSDKSSHRMSVSSVTSVPLDPVLFPPDRGIDFSVGSKIRALDEFGKWYNAKIIDLRPREGQILVHFDYWSKRFDEWIVASSSRLTAIDCESVKRDNSIEPFEVGDFVFAKWTDAVGTYPAQIVESLECDKYKLLYYDGFEKVAHKRCLKKMTNEEVQKLDLVNFGQLKLLPANADEENKNKEKKDGRRKSLRAKETTEKGADYKLEMSSAKDLDSRDTTATASNDVSTTPKPVADVAKRFGQGKKQKEEESGPKVSADVSPTKSSSDSEVLFLSQIIKQNRPENKKDSSSSKRFNVTVSGSKLILKADKSKSRRRLTKKFSAGKASKVFGRRRKCDMPVKHRNVFTLEEDISMCTLLCERFAEKDPDARRYRQPEIWAKIKSKGHLTDRSAHSLSSHIRFIFRRFDTLKQHLPSETCQLMISNCRELRPVTLSVSETFLAAYPATVEFKREDQLGKVISLEWFAGRRTWLDEEQDRTFCRVCRTCYSKGNICHSSWFFLGLSDATLLHIEKHEISRMHGYAVVWWNTNKDFERCPAVLLPNNYHYSANLDDPQVLKAYEIGRKSHDNRVARMTSGKCNMSGRDYQLALNFKQKTAASLSSPKLISLEKPREIANNDPVFWLRVEGLDEYYCLACRNHSDLEGSIWKEKVPASVATCRDKLDEHGKSADHAQCLKDLFKRQKEIVQQHSQRLKNLAAQQECGIFTCPFSFCIMVYKSKQDLETHLKLIHRKPDENTQQIAIRCVCSMNKRDKNLIQCLQCSMWQHKSCFGFTEHEPEFYSCYQCSEISKDSMPFERVKQECYSTYVQSGDLPGILNNSACIPSKLGCWEKLVECGRSAAGIDGQFRHIDSLLASQMSTHLTSNVVEMDSLYELAEKQINGFDKLLADLEGDRLENTLLFSGDLMRVLLTVQNVLAVSS